MSDDYDVDANTDHMFCPTCGRPTTHKASPEWLLGYCRGLFAGIVATLIEGRNKRRGTSLDEIVMGAYAYSGIKVPIDPVGTVRMTMSGNKNKLEKRGWKIVGPRITGNGYWLVPLERE